VCRESKREREREMCCVRVCVQESRRDDVEVQMRLVVGWLKVCVWRGRMCMRALLCVCKRERESV